MKNNNNTANNTPNNTPKRTVVIDKKNIDLDNHMQMYNFAHDALTDVITEEGLCCDKLYSIEEAYIHGYMDGLRKMYDLLSRMMCENDS